MEPDINGLIAPLHTIKEKVLQKQKTPVGAYQQSRITLTLGRREMGEAMLSRWKLAAQKVHNSELHFLEWIRNTCDREAQRILGPKK